MTFPQGAELLRRVMESRLLDVHTALPCRVESFDSSAQTADIQPMIKNVIIDADGAELEESYPLLRSVPILYPRSGKYFVAFPLAEGDFVLAIFAEWSVDHFMEKGKESHPIDLKRHGLDGAVAIPVGPFPTDSPISETLDSLILGEDGGALMKVKDDGHIEAIPSGAGVVNLGASGSADALVRGTTYRAAEVTLDTALGVGWTALATIFTTLAADPAHAAVQTALTTAAAACTTAAAAITTFEGGAANYLSTKAKTTA